MSSLLPYNWEICKQTDTFTATHFLGGIICLSEEKGDVLCDFCYMGGIKSEVIKNTTLGTLVLAMHKDGGDFFKSDNNILSFRIPVNELNKWATKLTGD
jgi:hypothetical protein